MPRAAAALASSFAFEDTPEARLRAALLRAKTAEAEVAALRDENESLRHELAVMMATTTTTAQTRCQPCARRAANAAPVASPPHVSAARVSSPLRVSSPDDVPHTGQDDPGSVVEKRPI